MYTKERDGVWEDHWLILDSNGNFIFTVVDEDDAETALEHLNRNLA